MRLALPVLVFACSATAAAAAALGRHGTEAQVLAADEAGHDATAAAEAAAYARFRVEEAIRAGHPIQLMQPMQGEGVTHSLDDSAPRFLEKSESESGAEAFPKTVPCALDTMSAYNGHCIKRMKKVTAMQVTNGQSPEGREYTLDQDGFKILTGKKYWKENNAKQLWGWMKKKWHANTKTQNVKNVKSFLEGEEDRAMNNVWKDLKSSLLPELAKCRRKIGGTKRCEHKMSETECNEVSQCQWNPPVELVMLDTYSSNNQYEPELSDTLESHKRMHRTTWVSEDDQISQKYGAKSAIIREKCTAQLTSRLGLKTTPAVLKKFGSMGLFSMHIDTQVQDLMNHYKNALGKEAYQWKTEGIKRKRVAKKKGYFDEMMNFWGPVDEIIQTAPLGFVSDGDPVENHFQCPKADNPELTQKKLAESKTNLDNAETFKNMVWAQLKRGEGYLFYTRHTPHAALPLYDADANDNCRTSVEFRFFVIVKDKPEHVSTEESEDLFRDKADKGFEQEKIEEIDEAM